MISPRRRLTRRHGRGTVAMLALAAGFTLFFFAYGPSRREIGGDSKVFYAAASLAARGGNPYDPARLGPEEDRLFNVPGHLQRGDPGYMYPAAYAYPPLYTRALELGLWLPWTAFYLAGAALMVASALAALEIIMRTIGWERRGLARAFLLVSSPLATTVFDWNPSAVVMLVWAVAFTLLTTARQNSRVADAHVGGTGTRPGAAMGASWAAGPIGASATAGAVLALGTFKLALGVPIAAAGLVAGGPFASRRSWLAGLAGFAAGCLVLLGLDLAVAHPGEMSSWLAGMAHLGGAFSDSLNGSLNPYAQTLLTGLPALLMDLPVAGHRLGTVAATLIAVLAVAALLAFVRPRLASLRQEPLLAPALAIAVALAVSPYVHVNDLLLDALPLLVVASLPLRPWSWLAPLTWFAGPPTRFALAILLGVLFHADPNTRAGWGVAMNAVLLLALAVAASGYASADAPPAADQRR